MKVALLIHVHRSPELAARICDRMSHPDIDIYINVDLKSNISDFKEMIPQARFVEPRLNIEWGKFSQVEATLHSLEHIAASDTRYDYVVFISGQDYTIVTPRELLNNLEQDKGAEYISFEPAHDKMTLKKAECYYHCFDNKYIDTLVRKITQFPPLRRTYPTSPIYKGDSWWNLTGECIGFILRFVKDNPQYVKYHRHTHCSDEMFFHNIIMFSPFAGRVVCDDKRYIVWLDNSPNPKILGTSDIESIMNSGDWFARKFDITRDSVVLDMIDRRLGIEPYENT